MKFLGFVLAGVLAAGTNASAQAFSSSYFVPNSAAAAASAATSNAAPDSAAALPDSPTPSGLAPVPAAVSSDSTSAEPARPQGGPVRVYEDFNFQGYLGLTFFRFYEAPPDSEPHRVRFVDVVLLPWRLVGRRRLALRGTR